MQYRYWGSGTKMSAGMKRDVARVRAARPELFTALRVKESAMDGEGKVTVTERSYVRATPLTGRQRHEFSLKKA